MNTATSRLTATPTATTDTAQPLSLWKPGVVAGMIAAAATTVTAIAARAIDIPLEVEGEQIPIAGFAQLTLIATAVGLVLAVLSRRARHPRRAFVRTALALTVLSLVPDVVIDADTASKVVLALTHLVAAAIVVPTLAKRLPR